MVKSIMQVYTMKNYSDIESNYNELENLKQKKKVEVFHKSLITFLCKKDTQLSMMTKWLFGKITKV